MKKTVFYNYNKHYDFIKSNEAKDIFLKLEKEKYLREGDENDGVEFYYEEEDFKKYFSYDDEEKKSIVKDFMFGNMVCQESMETLRELENNCSYERFYRDFDEFQSELIKTLSLKKDLDPEYIYEHWQVEKLRFFNEMYRVCKDKNNEKYEHENSFVLDSL